MQDVVERVDRLEEMMIKTQLMVQGLSMEVSRTQINIRELSQEMKEFKNEMKEFKNEMKEFKNEMKEFKNEMREDTKKLRREIGENSRKIGTLVEDMVAPNIEYIAKKYFNLKNGKISVRTDVYHPITNQKREFDTIAVYPDKIILNETKSNPKTSEVKNFIGFIKSGEFYDYFPEYKDKKLIPVFASLYLPEDTIKFLSKNKIYAMAMKEDTMDILNPNF